MKKLILLFAAACMISVSSCCKKQDGACGDQSKTECCKKDSAQCAEKKACCEKWAKFDSLSVEEQTTILAKRKEALDSCQAKTKAKVAAIDAKFAGYDALTIAEKKQLFDELDACKKQCCDKKKACGKEEKSCCKKDEAKQCDKK